MLLSVLVFTRFCRSPLHEKPSKSHVCHFNLSTALRQIVLGQTCVEHLKTPSCLQQTLFCTNAMRKPCAPRGISPAAILIFRARIEEMFPGSTNHIISLKNAFRLTGLDFSQLPTPCVAPETIHEDIIKTCIPPGRVDFLQLLIPCVAPESTHRNNVKSCILLLIPAVLICCAN